MALGIFLRSAGYFAWSTLICTSVFMAWHFERYLWSYWFDIYPADPVLWLYRSGLAALLAGGLICRLILRGGSS